MDRRVKQVVVHSVSTIDDAPTPVCDRLAQERDNIVNVSAMCGCLSLGAANIAGGSCLKRKCSPLVAKTSESGTFAQTSGSRVSFQSWLIRL